MTYEYGSINPVGIYLFKDSRGNINTICEIFLKSIIKREIVDYKHVSHFALVLPLPTVNKQILAGKVAVHIFLCLVYNVVFRRNNVVRNPYVF